MTQSICCRCGKPVLPGQLRYTIDESHYRCKELDDKRFSDAMTALPGKMNEVRDALAALKRKLR